MRTVEAVIDEQGNVRLLEPVHLPSSLWQESERIRAYIAAFRERVEEWGGRIDPRSETAKWLNWAIDTRRGSIH